MGGKPVLVANCDDPLSVEGAQSDATRNSVAEWFVEAVPTRLNSPLLSAILVIMQRLHEEDPSGIILSKELGYEHLMIPMEFEVDRKCYTSIGWEDPRTTEGELAFPDRFPREVVERDKKIMGSFATAGQFQQRPSPKGGGLIKRDWWQLWDDEAAQLNGVVSCEKYPTMEYVILSLDTAYTEKKENDPTAATVWGVWYDKDGHMRLMLMYAWSERLAFHPLMQKIMKTAKQFKVDRVLIEAKASGISIAQEVARLSAGEDYGVQLLNPGAYDKMARLMSVSHFWENGLIYCPDEVKFMWVDQVIAQMESFPKAKHDDYVDSSVQCVSYLRNSGLLVMPKEIDEINHEAAIFRGKKKTVADRYFR